MPAPALYDASVPVFLRYLERLAGLVARADDALLPAQLAPGMLPFGRQVEVAANFSVRACAPLAGRAAPPELAPAADCAALLRHIERARSFVAAIAAHDFADAESRVCTERAGAAELALDARTFLFQYALPNFFFHLSIAYALLRREGVPIGKADFDGFHVYARAG